MRTFTIWMVVTTALALVTFSGQTTAAVTRCDNCTPWAYQQAAISMGFGRHYVYDIPNDTLVRYRVWWPGAGEPWESEAIAVEPHMQDYFDELSTALDLSGGTKSLVIQIGPNTPLFPGDHTGGDAYTYTRNRTLRSNFARSLVTFTSNQTANNVVQAFWAALQGAADAFSVDLSVTIHIVWSDGSTQVFKIDRDNLIEAEYQVGESRDSEGNIVPDEGADDQDQFNNYQGEWTFGNGGNLTNWLQNAALYGIDVVGTSGSLLSCGRSCYTSGGVTTCRIVCTRR